jgi:hypothetical protein
VRRLRTRLNRVEGALGSAPEDTPELRLAWCLENGHDPASTIIGLGTHLVFVLPPEVP